MSDITKLFGSMVFDDRVMKERLPADLYAAMQNTIRRGKRLDVTMANAIADVMKNWAIGLGATHFTHWFQPMTGITAEKHDSFISPTGDGGVIMELSGKELVFGEPDASALPSGGLRATFEARGYTAWDPTSYAFVKDNTLYIPTAFCSFGGEALDMKTPLLRSMEVLQKQALRIIRLFGNNDVQNIRTTVGPEQEYFLIDRELFEKRPDLIFTGRTLIGAKPPKGQELGDHYFGNIKPRVKAFMEELNAELWKLGVLAKTEHNEAAPSQHELAPIFSTANMAADHNQLTMSLMQKTARKYDMVCLLHEKPFEGINGSGKHNNWSLCTDTGINLLNPGETPAENAQFLLFLSAVIMAVDEFQDLLRISVASPGNDHRLGASEAPPAIVSIYLGDELLGILESIENDMPYGTHEKELLKIGAHVLPKIPKDTTDRNRTSPFAFTGNKFEFRMPGSAMSISDANTVLNTAVAYELRRFADALEASDHFDEDIHEIIKLAIRDHRRILFNGNGYDAEWIKEAESRGLCNYRTTPDALAHFLDEKNVRLFCDSGVYSYAEMCSRYQVLLGNYSKIEGIEAQTLIGMVKSEILPAVSKYKCKLADAVNSIISAIDMIPEYEIKTLTELSDLSSRALHQLEELEKADSSARKLPDTMARAESYRDKVIPAMNALRETVDKLEALTSKDFWPYPSYADLLFSIK